MSWASQRERGSDLPLRAMVWLTLTLGWPVGRVLLWPITLYFMLSAAGARRASADYLRRVLGRRVGPVQVFRHLHTFAGVILDRVFFLTGRTARYTVDIEGLRHLEAVVAGGTGCVLLGSHLGSFEAMRTLAAHCPVGVKILMYRANSGALSRLLDRLNPSLAAGVIEIGRLNSMLRVREAVERREIVGMLADRAPAGQRSLRAPFLGQDAAFPAGPLALAATLGVPVVLCFGIRTGPRRYRVLVEHFADRVVLAPERRAADLTAWIGRYAARLAARCREYPYNWFNFYDFWDGGQDSAGSGGVAAEPVEAAGSAGADAAGDRAAGDGRRVAGGRAAGSGMAAR